MRAILYSEVFQNEQCVWSAFPVLYLELLQIGQLWQFVHLRLMAAYECNTNLHLLKDRPLKR